MTALPKIIEKAMQDSRSGRPVLLVLLAPNDCDDSKKFLPTLTRIENAFQQGLHVERQQGSNKKREQNPADMQAALAAFGYEKTPGDGGSRGHFPCGAVYLNGAEVYRLPSDSVLAKIPPQTLANAITAATGVPYDWAVLLKRGGWHRLFLENE